jgi:hypothetical protein
LSRDFNAGFEGRTHVVKWYVNDVVGGDPWNGIITRAGTYVAPANVPADGFVTVRARSLEDPTLEGTAIVQITASPTNSFVVVSPDTATVPASGTVGFTGTVSGCGSDSVIWSLELVSGVATAGLGSIDEEGTYVGPATSGDNFEVLVKAAGAGCIAKSGIAKVKVPAQPRSFIVELEGFTNKFNVPGSEKIRVEHCSVASSGEAVVGLDRNGEYIEIPLYVRGGGDYIAHMRYASDVGTRSWVTIEVDGCGAAGSSAGFTLDQGEGTT